MELNSKSTKTMKKIRWIDGVYILAAMLLFGFILSGCSSTADSTVESDNSVEASLENSVLDQRPQGRATISGTVVAIEGNAITIESIVLPEGEEGQRGGDGADITEEEREAQREQFQNMSDEDREARRDERLADAEYEEVEVTIPVGVPIIEIEGGGRAGGFGQGRGAGGPGGRGGTTTGTDAFINNDDTDNEEQSEIEYDQVYLSDISKDQQISLWKDGDSIVFVQIQTNSN